MTQCLFYTFEYAEIQFSGLRSYFHDAWNYIDSSQGIFYLIQIYMTLQIYTTLHGFDDEASLLIDRDAKERFWLEIIQVVCII